MQCRACVNFSSGMVRLLEKAGLINEGVRGRNSRKKFERCQHPLHDNIQTRPFRSLHAPRVDELKKNISFYP